MNGYKPQKNAFITDQIKDAIKYTKWAHTCIQRICEQNKTVSSVYLDEINQNWMKELSNRVNALLFDINY